MDKIEIQVVCANCSDTRIKSYDWLKQKHLPCPNCGKEFVVNSSHMATVERKMQDALRDMDKISGTCTVTLKL